MLVIIIVTLFTVNDGLPIQRDFDDDQFNSEEFEYFYNMELVEKFALLGDTEDTGDESITLHDLEVITDTDSGNNTEQVDKVLDQLIEEGNRIENVLNEFVDNQKKMAILSDNMEEIDFSASLLYEILYWLFLSCFILMMIFSLAVTGRYFLENPSSSSKLHSQATNRADLEFVFLR